MYYAFEEIDDTDRFRYQISIGKTRKTIAQYMFKSEQREIPKTLNRVGVTSNNNKMKSVKFLPALLVLLIAAFGAFATAKTYAPTLVYYPVGVPNTPSEDCVPYLVDKDCTLAGTGCVDNIDGVGTNIQLYQTFEEIDETGRFKCLVTLQED